MYKFRTYGYDSPEMKPLKTKPNRDEEKKKQLKSVKNLSKLQIGNIH